MVQSSSAIGQTKVILVGMAVIFAVSAAVLVSWLSSAATVIGTSPGQAITLAPGASNGILGPGEQRWFSFSPNQTGNPVEDINLSAIFTVGNGAPLHNVNFELFTAGEVVAWQQGGKATPASFGVGMPVVSSETPGLSERVWRGALYSDGLYYLMLRNSTEMPVDYWLFDNAPAEIPAPVAEVEPTAVPAPVVEPTVEPAPAASAPAAEPAPAPAPSALGLSPESAIPLVTEPASGNLAPGQSAWFSFSIDNSPDAFEPMSLTLIITPNDFDQIYSIPMDIYTAMAVAAGSPQSLSNFEAVGSGSIVQRDNDPWTGEKVWGGWVVNAETYYVKIVNNHVAPIDYRLYPGDVVNP